MHRVSKVCFKCEKRKKLENFYAHPGMSGGRLNKCKDCTKSDVRKHYSVNKTRCKEYEVTRNKTEKRKADKARYLKEHRKKYPEKNKARQAVKRALTKGTLIKKPCEFCGDKKVHGHHDDYGKPLVVRWLCVAHHHEVHRKNF